MNNKLVLPLTAALALALPALQAAPADGTYSAKVNGHNAPMTVTVKIVNHKIDSIDTSKNLETIGVGKLALGKLSKRMVETQSVNVDNVTGATLSSFAIKKGVRDCLTQAGAAKNEFNKKVDTYPTKDETIDTQVVV